MSLTYQPFAENPKLDTVRPDTSPNVAANERFVSVICGAVLGIFGGSRGSFPGTLLGILGGALIWRGVTGYCPSYDSLGVASKNSLRDPDLRKLGGQRSARLPKRAAAKS